MSWHVAFVATAVGSTPPNTADWLTAAGTLGTFGVAFAAAWVAGGQLFEARRLREAQAQPFVVVDVEPSIVSRRILKLVIRNVGQTLARNVRVTFEPPLKSTIDSTGYPIGEFRAIKNGIPAMPPGREYQVVLDSTVERFHSDLPDNYIVVVEFDDRDGKKTFNLTYEIDLGMYRSAPYVQEHSINDVVDELVKMRNVFDSWARMTGEHLHGMQQSAESSSRVPQPLYRFRTRRRHCDLLLGRMSRLRKDRGLCLSACSI